MWQNSLKKMGWTVKKSSGESDGSPSQYLVSC